MSLSASTAWEVRTGGSDTANSGGFRFGAMIAAPSIPTVTPSSSGGTVAAGDYYCVITYTDNNGETVISSETHITLTGATSSFVVTHPSAATGASTWSLYVATVSNGPYFPQGTGLSLASNRSVTTTPPTSGTQPRGVDYSVQNSAQISVSDAVANGTTTVTSATAAFTGLHVGNVVKIGSAYYDIVSVTNATTIVVDRTITTGTGLTLIVGGGFATPGGQAAVSTTNTHLCFMKAGTYTINNGSTNTAGNFVQQSMSIIGYNTNRYVGNTDSSKPVWDAGAASMTMLWCQATKQLYQNLSFTNSATRSSVTAININSTYMQIDHCDFDHVTTGLAYNDQYSTVQDCSFISLASGNQGTGIGAKYIRCLDSGSGGTVFNLAIDGSAIDCLAINSTANPFVCTDGGLFLNCTAYNWGSTSNAFNLNGEGSRAVNCLVWGPGGSSIGFQETTSVYRNSITNCAAGNCGTNFSTRFGTNQLINTQTLTSIPFTNAGSGDFSLNNTASAGAACRAAGIPGVFPGLSTTTGYIDIGAIQTLGSASGGPVSGNLRGGFVNG